MADSPDRFPDDATAEAWFIERRWPDGVRCPHCGFGMGLDCEIKTVTDYGF